MRESEAQTKECPDRMHMPGTEGYFYRNCITTSCMAWHNWEIEEETGELEKVETTTPYPNGEIGYSFTTQPVIVKVPCGYCTKYTAEED